MNQGVHLLVNSFTDFPYAPSATIVTKTACELVQITREDYNIMLKKDQLEFIQRMQVTSPGEGVSDIFAADFLKSTKKRLLAASDESK